MKKIYFLFSLILVTSFASAQVVISQAYGGGGNSGSTYTHDFVELHNNTSSSVSLNGWSVQYASATGTSWAVTVLPNVTLQPGQYYLIQQAQGSGGTTPLPAPDLIPETPTAMAGTNFKILLANTIDAQTGTCPTGAQIIDFAGFGSANCSEGTAAPVLSNTLAGLRLNNGCQDTNNNSADFITGAPTPRNTASAVSICSNGPALTITSPSSGAVFAPNATVTVGVVVSNFVVGNPGAGIDGYIEYTLTPGGTEVSKFDTAPIEFPGLAAGEYILDMQLVDNSGNPLGTPVTATVTFEVAALTIVADLAALRADVVANGAGKYYQVSSQPVATYTRTTRNQKYVQDASGAILIDDQPGTITTTVAVGDAISGLTGMASLFNGLLQLLPTSNVTVASSGNVVTPQVVTIAALLADVQAYESELVQINGVTFADVDGGTGVFTVNTSFNITNAGTIIFRTAFAEANYIGQTLPAGAVNIAVLVGNFNGTAQVTSRNAADLALLSAPSFNAISGLKMYPNPVNNGMLYIASDANAQKAVVIYDIVGKEVINTVTADVVNVSNLNSGVYIVKITEEGNTATRKLVIR